MTKQEIIEKFCALSTRVAEKVYGHKLPSDCFCKESDSDEEFRFDDEVFKFIHDAVNRAIRIGGKL